MPVLLSRSGTAHPHVPLSTSGSETRFGDDDKSRQAVAESTAGSKPWKRSNSAWWWAWSTGTTTTKGRPRRWLSGCFQRRAEAGGALRRGSLRYRLLWRCDHRSVPGRMGGDDRAFGPLLDPVRPAEGAVVEDDPGDGCLPAPRSQLVSCIWNAPSPWCRRPGGPAAPAGGDRADEPAHGVCSAGGTQPGSSTW